MDRPANEKEARALMDANIKASFDAYRTIAASAFAGYLESKRLNELRFHNWQRTGRFETGEVVDKL